MKVMTLNNCASWEWNLCKV